MTPFLLGTACWSSITVVCVCCDCGGTVRDVVVVDEVYELKVPQGTQKPG